MDHKPGSDDLGISSRLRRFRGRDSRTQSIATRVTSPEEAELNEAARKDGRALSEWMRETLLHRARSADMESAIITEIVALRMLMSTVLRTIALGDKLTPEAYAQILSEIRTGKHEAMRDVLTQYAPSSKE